MSKVDVKRCDCGEPAIERHASGLRCERCANLGREKRKTAGVRVPKEQGTYLSTAEVASAAYAPAEPIQGGFGRRSIGKL